MYYHNKFNEIQTSFVQNMPNLDNNLTKMGLEIFNKKRQEAALLSL